MNTSQILAMLNQKIARAESNNALLKQQLEEVQGQYAYECECNKQFVETQNKCERLSHLLWNALSCIEEEQIFDTHERMLDWLAMTEKEYNEIMGEE